MGNKRDERKKMRKTKIIATLGPATDSYGKIVSLIKPV